MKKQKEKEDKERKEILRMINICVTQMEGYQIELAKASKGYSYWNHKLKELEKECEQNNEKTKRKRNVFSFKRT